MTSPSTNSVAAFHDQLAQAHGVLRATGFSLHGQQARFQAALRGLEPLKQWSRLLDFGCNVGDFYAYLLERGFHGQYVGIDLNPAFIKAARERFPKKDLSIFPKRPVSSPIFECADLLDPADALRVESLSPQVVVASGVFSYAARKEQNPTLLKKLYKLAGTRLIANFLKTYSGRRVDPELLSYRSEEVLKLIEECDCPSWELWHNYLPNDFTVIMNQ